MSNSYPYTRHTVTTEIFGLRLMIEYTQRGSELDLEDIWITEVVYDANYYDIDWLEIEDFAFSTIDEDYARRKSEGFRDEE